MKNDSLQITSDSWYEKSKFRLFVNDKKLYSTVCINKTYIHFVVV